MARRVLHRLCGGAEGGADQQLYSRAATHFFPCRCGALTLPAEGLFDPLEPRRSGSVEGLDLPRDHFVADIVNADNALVAEGVGFR
jgi:hypothetical protein